jgi:hypothetical protein
VAERDPQNVQRIVELETRVAAWGAQHVEDRARIAELERKVDELTKKFMSTCSRKTSSLAGDLNFLPPSIFSTLATG